MMTQSIDVTGLTPADLKTVERVVEALRKQAVAETVSLSTGWTGPPKDETAEEWVVRFRAWCQSHPKRDIVIDDSRESIYDRETE